MLQYRGAAPAAGPLRAGLSRSAPPRGPKPTEISQCPSSVTFQQYRQHRLLPRLRSHHPLPDQVAFRSRHIPAHRLVILILPPILRRPHHNHAVALPHPLHKPGNAGADSAGPPSAARPSRHTSRRRRNRPPQPPVPAPPPGSPGGPWNSSQHQRQVRFVEKQCVDQPVIRLPREVPQDRLALCPVGSRLAELVKQPELLPMCREVFFDVAMGQPPSYPWPPLASLRPAGSKATAQTWPLCPSIVRRHSPAPASHSRIVPSSDGDASNRPSGDHAIRPISPVCPLSVRRSLTPAGSSSGSGDLGLPSLSFLATGLFHHIVLTARPFAVYRKKPN